MGKTPSTALIIPKEQIIRKIFLLREEKVMPDTHLAEIYGVENRALKQAVRRNIASDEQVFLYSSETTHCRKVINCATQQ